MSTEDGRIKSGCPVCGKPFRLKNGNGYKLGAYCCAVHRELDAEIKARAFEEKLVSGCAKIGDVAEWEGTRHVISGVGSGRTNFKTPEFLTRWGTRCGLYEPMYPAPLPPVTVPTCMLCLLEDKK